jgi:hypothetical protein
MVDGRVVFSDAVRINEMHGSRSKIPSINLVKKRCADGFNYGVKGLKENVHECVKDKVHQ